jgi:hypothetical protein
LGVHAFRGQGVSIDWWALSTTALGALAAICVVSVPVPAAAADADTPSLAPPLVTKDAPPTALPAVSDFNAKWEAIGGSIGDQTLAGSLGSISAPLDSQFGVQLDGLAASYGGNFLGGGAGHLFWRDPAIGLVGIYGSALAWDRLGGVAAGNAAIEAERYWNRWSFTGVAGAEFGNNKTQLTPITGGSLVNSFDIKTRFFDQINVSYYLTNNFKVSVGQAYLGGKNAATFGGEFGFQPWSGTMGSLFVEGLAGEDGFHGVLGGLRVYFARDDKTLIDRNRQDDPNNWLATSVNTLSNSHTVTTVPSPAPASGGAGLGTASSAGTSVVTSGTTVFTSSGAGVTLASGGVTTITPGTPGKLSTTYLIQK